MSAGVFERTRYESNSGRIYSIEVQPETLLAEFNAVANAAPVGAVNQEVTARARGSKRAYGVTARKVLVQFTASLPTGYSGDPLYIPILTPTVFNGIEKDQAGTYLANPIRVLEKSSEQVR